MDLINDLRELALASRLKRLSDRLMRDVATIYEELDVDFAPRWFPVFQVLGRGGPRSVTETAQALGLTHPAVNQVVGAMRRHGLVATGGDPDDERRTLLSLTPKGEEIFAALQPAWEAIRASTAEVLADAGSDLLAHLERVEHVVDRRDVGERVRERLGLPPRDSLVIEDYRPAYKKHFASLNLAWLEERFRVEEHDRALLDDPNRRILRRGGAILFAVLRGEVVGTCALIRRDDGVYELAKMAVAAPFRGRGIGRRLGEAVLARARELGARSVVLATSPELEAAGALYASLGFRPVDHGPAEEDGYERCSVSMRLDLVPAGAQRVARAD